MNGRRWGGILAAALPFCGAALELAELPEVLATVDGRPLLRAEVASQLAPQLARLNAEGATEAEIRRAVRRVVDDALCLRLVEEELRKNALSPSREVAERYLAGELDALPPLARMRLEHELRPRLETREFQLKAAVHLYLAKRFPPEALAVSPAEIERYYQLNRMRYRQPERWDVGVIRIDRKRPNAADLAAAARARLLQGGNFESVAREFDPDGGGSRLPADELRALFARELAALSPGDVSGVVSAPEAFFVLLLRRREPGGVIPLAEALPYIRLELSAVKDTLALRKVLIGDFAAGKVVYAPFLRP